MPRSGNHQLDEDDQEAVAEFEAMVNMLGRELEAWLNRDDEEHEVVDEQRQASRRVVSILGKRRLDYTSSDIAHMRKTVGYIHRHLAQQPATEGSAQREEWRRTLMRWGHDPDRNGRNGRDGRDGRYGVS